MIELIKSWIGKERQPPIFNVLSLLPPICHPITLLFDKFNIGEPDEANSVLQE